jgi:hypothetical protein
VSQGGDAKEGYKAEQPDAQFEVAINAHRVNGARDEAGEQGAAQAQAAHISGEQKP